MRIAILTLPLQSNYGGLIQAYALQTYLESMGHQITILDRRFNGHNRGRGWIIESIAIPKYYLKSLYKRMRGTYIREKLTETETSIIYSTTRPFINSKIHLSTPLWTTRDMRSFIRQQAIDAIIVGSDQVWRPCYTPNIANYFLNFTKGLNIKRIAYAASFGTNQWEYKAMTTTICKKSLSRFDAVSVREDTALSLCQEKLNCMAELVLDPTLLLQANDYRKLYTETFPKGGLFCYILDRTERKKHIEQEIVRSTNMVAFWCKTDLPLTYENIIATPEKCVCPPLEEWLQDFDRADMVLTDSFHGVIFSILYHKPFWIISNAERGRARFDSLLHMFDLEDRIVPANATDNFKWNKTIDWETVEKKLDFKRKQSKQFLATALHASGN